MHRDLKPENILFENQEHDSEIKLIDFGLSIKHNSNEKIHTILGTPYYIAPEVLTGSYDDKCDVWGIGVITYTIICGNPPFRGKNNSHVYEKIKNSEPLFDKEKWKYLSANCIDFIKKCLVKNPENRFNASKALEHNWLSKISSEIHSTKKIDNKIFVNLAKFSKPDHFKKLVLKFLVNNISQKELKRLRDAFSAIDINNSGFIEFNELELAFKNAEIVISKEELYDIFKDGEFDGKIDYTEFISASLDQKSFICKENIISAFKYFDADSNGEIDSKDLKKVLLKTGRNVINLEELDETILEINHNKDKISIKEFLELFGLN